MSLENVDKPHPIFPESKIDFRLLERTFNLHPSLVSGADLARLRVWQAMRAQRRLVSRLKGCRKLLGVYGDSFEVQHTRAVLAVAEAAVGDALWVLGESE